MSFCWLGETKTLRDILQELGHSRQSLKKSELSRKSLEKVFKKGDTVTLPDSVINRGEINPSYCDQCPKPVVLEEREEILALSKPSKVHCHPYHYGEKDNLLSFLREKGYDSFLNCHRESMDRGLLYRLDYETSGLVLLTKNENLLQRARKGNLITKKKYYALVEGEYKGPKDLTHYLSTSGKVVKEDQEGTKAELKIEEVSFKSSSGFTLLKVELLQGLRHQIRVQLSLAGHPIVGDTLYGALAHENFGLHCLSYSLGEESFKDPSFWAIS